MLVAFESSVAAVWKQRYFKLSRLLVLLIAVLAMFGGIVGCVLEQCLCCSNAILALFGRIVSTTRGQSW